MKVKVYNMISNSGNPITNQFEIFTDKGKYFQSYRSIIVFVDNKDQVFLDEDKWNYSRTTSKYRNIFLNDTTSSVKEKIMSGEYKFKELN